VREYMCKTEMASPAVPFASAMSACCWASGTPLLNVTMYGTAPPGGVAVVSVEEEEVSVELEEVSVEVVSDEGAEVVSVVASLLAAVVSVLVLPTIDNDSPNAPEAMRPNAKRTARPIPIRSDRFRSVR
jgi:hypothetical protein